MAPKKHEHFGLLDLAQPNVDPKAGPREYSENRNPGRAAHITLGVYIRRNYGDIIRRAPLHGTKAPPNGTPCVDA
jgi:hypothetical protein